MIQKLINEYLTLPLLLREFEIHERKSLHKSLPHEGLWLRWVRGGLGYSLKEFSCIGRCEFPLKLNAKHNCQVTECSFAQGFLNSFAPTSSPAPYRLSLSTPRLLVKRAQKVNRYHFTLTLFGQSIDEFEVWRLAVQRALLIGLGKNYESYLVDRVIDPLEQKILWSVNPFDTGQYTEKVTKKTIPTLAHFLEKTSNFAYIPKQVQVTFLTAIETKLLDSLDRQSTLSISLEQLILLIVRRLKSLNEIYNKEFKIGDNSLVISREMMKHLCQGSRVKRARLKRRPIARRGGPIRIIGNIVYALPASKESTLLIAKILHIGQLIGIGRGTIEGRGSLEIKFS